MMLRWVAALITNNFFLPSGMYVFTQPLCTGRVWHKANFKRSLTGLNSEFFSSLTGCLTNAKEFGLPYYLPINEEWIIAFIPFPSVLVLCEMQSALSRIWEFSSFYIVFFFSFFVCVSTIFLLIITSFLIISLWKHWLMNDCD